MKTTSGKILAQFTMRNEYIHKHMLNDELDLIKMFGSAPDEVREEIRKALPLTLDVVDCIVTTEEHDDDSVGVEVYIGGNGLAPSLIGKGTAATNTQDAIATVVEDIVNAD